MNALRFIIVILFCGMVPAAEFGPGPGPAPAAAPAFSALTAGTSTGKAFVIGNGGSLTTSGTGTITANSVSAMPWDRLTASTANLSLAMSAFTTGFTWNTATSGTQWTQSSSSLSSGTLASYLVSGTAAASNTQTALNVGTSGANATATQTTYGAKFANTHTGTTSTNVGALFNASGATNNYAAIFNAGNVGIGTTTPDSKLEVGGITSGRTAAYAGQPLSGIALRLNPVATEVTNADMTTAVVIDPTYDDTVGSNGHIALAFPNGGNFISFGRDTVSVHNPGYGQASQYMCYWYSNLAAFRAGRDNGTRFSDDANVGFESAAFNLAGAEGTSSFAVNSADASGVNSFAQGNSTLASGVNAAAFNSSSVASGVDASAFGSSTASGLRGFAAAAGNAGGQDSVALGYGNSAGSTYCVAIGNLNNCSQQRAMAFGESNTCNNFVAYAFGYTNISSGSVSVAIGDSTSATADRAFTIGAGVDTTHPMVNAVTYTLGIGFNSTVPTLFVSSASGAGTYGRIGIANSTTTPAAGLENAWIGAASVPAELISGTWFTGGSATTTKPQLLVQPTGTTSTTWSTNGTGLGINAASGFVGNLIDVKTNNSSSLFKVTSTGATSIGNTLAVSSTFTTAGVSALGSASTLSNTLVSIPSSAALSNNTTVNGVRQSWDLPSTATFGAHVNLSFVGTPAAAITVEQITHFMGDAADMTIGATSALTRSVNFGSIHGTGATNNYGFLHTSATNYGSISVDTGNWAFLNTTTDAMGTYGALQFKTVGTGIVMKSGTGAFSGEATLVGGTVTVTCGNISSANSHILLTRKTSGGTLGTAITYTISDATSFTINSDSAIDTSTFTYLVVNTN